MENLIDSFKQGLMKLKELPDGANEEFVYLVI